MEILPFNAPTPLAETSHTPRPSGNSVADTQIQLLKLMDKSRESNYYGYEDWRDDLWEILPSCDTRNDSEKFRKANPYSSYTGDSSGFMDKFLIFALVMIIVLALFGRLTGKKIA